MLISMRIACIWLLSCLLLVCCDTTGKTKNENKVQPNSPSPKTTQETSQNDAQAQDEEQNAAKKALLFDKAGLQDVEISNPEPTLPFDTIKISVDAITPQPIENKMFNIAQVKKKIQKPKTSTQQKNPATPSQAKTYDDVAKIPTPLEAEAYFKSR